MSCQSAGRTEGAHPGGPSGVLGGGQGVSRAIAVCRPAGPQRFLWTVEGIRTGRGESGVALQPRAGNRGEVGGSGLRDVGMECWADGQGGAQDKVMGMDREGAQDPGRGTGPEEIRTVESIGKGRGCRTREGVQRGLGGDQDGRGREAGSGKGLGAG